MTARRYISICALGVLAALAVVALFNVVVDPFGAFPRLHMKTFAHLRESIFSRVARAELARNGDWDMLVLGTSRPKIGMPFKHAAYGSNRVCNLSLDAGRMSEMRAVLDFARQHNRLRRVLLCLDLAIVREGGGLNMADFNESRFNPELSLFEYHCKNLVGANATDESFGFVVRRLSGVNPPDAQRNGFHVRVLGPKVRQREVFERAVRSLSFSYSVLRESPSEMKALREVLSVCREGGIELTLAINPVHALDLEVMRVAGTWGKLEQWKREVAKMLAEESLEGRVALWDFSGFAGPVAEPVPPENDSSTRMKYYYEHSHYTPALGALMLDRMYCGVTNAFGTQITTANIESHLARLRADRDVYVAANNAEVQWVYAVAKKALAARKQAAADVE